MSTFDFDCALIRKRSSTDEILDEELKQFSIKRKFEAVVWSTQFNRILMCFSSQKLKIILIGKFHLNNVNFHHILTHKHLLIKTDKEGDRNIFECNRYYSGYDRYQLNVDDVRNWLIEQDFDQGETIKMYVEEINTPVRNFLFKCALVRERTASPAGLIIHDGFSRISCESNLLWGLEGKLKTMFPSLDSPTHFIFIGRTLN